MTARNTALINLAAKVKPATKVAARAALKAARMKQTLADELLAATEELRSLRDSKKVAAFKAAHKPTGRPAVCLPAGTPATRLKAFRRAAVEKVYCATYREATHGSVDVVLTTNPAAVGVRQVESLAWDSHRGKHKGKPARVQGSAVTVPADWRVRVERRGLGVMDGMMTLDAAPIEARGCELFAAVWAVPGRGTSVAATRGYIARSGSVTYHGATIDQTLTGIARKSPALALTAMLAAADLGELVAKCPGLSFSVADARLVGACEYGIKSWCNAVGLDYEAGSAPLVDVYAAYQREPRAEARAAIVHALRRARTLVAQ